MRLYDTIHSRRDWISAQPGVAGAGDRSKGIDDAPIVASPSGRAIRRARPSKPATGRAGGGDRTEGSRAPATGPLSAAPTTPSARWMDAERSNAFGVTLQEIAGAPWLPSNALQPSGQPATAGNREVLVQTGTYLELPPT